MNTRHKILGSMKDDERMNAMASVYQSVNRMLLNDRINVKFVDDGPAPAWTDGQTVFFNKKNIETADLDDIVRMHGLNFHEIGHIKFSPRMSTMVRKFVLQRGMFEAYILLEDPRQERLTLARYPSATPWINATIARWIVAPGGADPEVMHLCTYGRRHLPQDIRDEARRTFIEPSMLAQFEEVIDAYLDTVYPSDMQKACTLIATMHHLLTELRNKHNKQQPPDPFGHDPKGTNDDQGKPENAQGQQQAKQQAKQQDKEREEQAKQQSKPQDDSDDDGSDSKSGDDKSESKQGDDESDKGKPSGDSDEQSDDQSGEQGDGDEDGDDAGSEAGDDGESGEGDDADEQQGDSGSDDGEGDDADTDADGDKTDAQDGDGGDGEESDKGDATDNTSTEDSGEDLTASEDGSQEMDSDAENGYESDGDGSDATGEAGDSTTGDQSQSGSEGDQQADGQQGDYEDHDYEETDEDGTPAGGSDPHGKSGDTTPDLDMKELAEKLLSEILQDKDLMEEIQRVQRQIVRATGSSRLEDNEWAAQPVSDEAKRDSRQFAKELQRVRAAAEPGTIRRTDGGRINAVRFKREGDPQTAFDRWDEGQQDAVDIEAVILVDLSGSMAQDVVKTLEQTWAIKRALDQVDASVSVISYENEGRWLYHPGDKADPGSMRYRYVSGFTHPTTSVQQAMTILAGSKRTLKILITLTDGDWDYDGEGTDSDKNADNIIKRLGDAGVVTALGFIKNAWHPAMVEIYEQQHGVGSWKVPSHNCQIVQALDAANLGQFGRTIVNNAIRRRLVRR